VDGLFSDNPPLDDLVRKRIIGAGNIPQEIGSSRSIRPGVPARRCTNRNTDFRGFREHCRGLPPAMSELDRMSKPMQPSSTKLACIWAAAAAMLGALAVGAPPAYTQQYAVASEPAVPPPSVAAPSLPIYSAPPLVPAQAPSPPTLLGGLQLIAYPYFWLAGLNMAITTPLQRAPQVNISAGAGEIISDISYMPFMGAAELRYGPFGIFADGLHIPLGVPITTRNIFFSGGSSAVVLNVATGDFLYRLFERPGQAIDGGLGFRWWGASADTTLVGRGPVPTQSVSVAGSWADPLIAARYHVDFGHGLGLTAYGDVGGFGIAAHSDWQISGMLDYGWNPSLSFRVGYRSLNVNYQASGKPLGYNVHMKGPLLGLVMRF
jgi:hypothetical protein